jgi:rod shape-determining protein MreC
MRNLLNFIVRYYFVFLFLILEVISFFLIAHSHNHQRTFFLHSGNAISGFFLRNADNFTSYLALRKINDLLAEENAQLLNLTNSAFEKRDSMIFTQKDSIMVRRFTYLNAKVINNSVIRRNNFITLNKGTNDGIEKDMGVITMNGVVGIVKNVSDNYSSVISLLHKDMQISARIKKNDHIGTLTWEGGNYRRASLAYIPSHVELETGDTIITSGFSRIFPEGIFIGTVNDFEIRRGENFFTAEINLALDFNKLTHVYVVNDLMAQELEHIEELNY